jgi:hypothetical protein
MLKSNDGNSECIMDRNMLVLVDESGIQRLILREKTSEGNSKANPELKNASEWKYLKSNEKSSMEYSI